MSNIIESWPTVVVADSACVIPPIMQPDVEALAQLHQAAQQMIATHTTNAESLRTYGAQLDQTRTALIEERQQLMAEVNSFKQLAMREVEQEREHLASVWKDLTSTLEREKAAMEGIQHFASEKIKLDIGGTTFATTLSTLTSEPESLLWSMFSGRFQLALDQDGSYFIDRDGRHFHHVLNYLREPSAYKPPTDPEEVTKVRVEAEYFLLPGLSQRLDGNQLPSGATSPMSPHSPVAFGAMMVGAALSPETSSSLEMVFKLVIIGDSQVGKSWLVGNYTNSWTEGSSYQPTMGVEFSSVEVTVSSNRLAKAQLWDIPGQDKYRGDRGTYYKGAAGAVVVYSAADRSSFEHVKSKWLPELRQFADDRVSIMLVGTKCDSTPSQVTVHEGEQFAEEIGALFVSSSSAGPSAISQVFELLISQIAKYRELVHRNASP